MQSFYGSLPFVADARGTVAGERVGSKSMEMMAYSMVAKTVSVSYIIQILYIQFTVALTIQTNCYTVKMLQKINTMIPKINTICKYKRN